MKMKKLVSLLLVGILALSLMGCAQEAQEDASAEPETTEEVAEEEEVEEVVEEAGEEEEEVAEDERCGYTHYWMKILLEGYCRLRGRQKRKYVNVI